MDYWTCPTCAIRMQTQSREPHLAGKRHAAAARAPPEIIPQATTLSRDGPKPWTCTICNIEMQSQSRESHLSGYRHAVASQQRESRSEVYPANDRSNHSSNSNSNSNSNSSSTLVAPSSTPAKILPANSGVIGIAFGTVFAASDATEVDGAPAVLVWLCTLCNCCVPLSAKQSHLSSADHIQTLLEMIKITCMTIPEPPFQDPNSYMGVSDSSGFENVAYETKRLAGRIRDQKSYGEATGASSGVNPLLKSTAPANMNSSPEDQSTPLGPLDAFFSSFHGYPYDSLIPPAKSFSSLRHRLGWWHNWDGNSPPTWREYEDDVFTQYQAALTKEFNLWYGTEDDIDSWHSLCRAIGIRPLPTTCDDCREAVQNMHVNIVDLIQWAREREVGQVDIFQTVKKLSDYSYTNDKIYRKDQLGQGAVLRCLLREIAKEQKIKFST